MILLFVFYLILLKKHRLVSRTRVGYDALWAIPNVCVIICVYHAPIYKYASSS
ncbi:hypothetical protein HMPREF1991_02857 [Hoylesella loescheii DSM 19665 = JCM 12249 = ATCC 15930]|uniref:Uncharacterized protein n=1 Tax=Hoylesella loescheii DSM 19665 = JCM 12249 = ATCC 15930 TaxID=1122985 RepID=A0A069QE41_HOYLO|nr:hypothetical protein HMPREF1991_02857 [Hoylesella loescheii DSM 19665 = JCM 12249 = ATCC 15930]